MNGLVECTHPDVLASSEEWFPDGCLINMIKTTCEELGAVYMEIIRCAFIYYQRPPWDPQIFSGCSLVPNHLPNYKVK